MKLGIDFSKEVATIAQDEQDAFEAQKAECQEESNRVSQLFQQSQVINQLQA